MSRNGGFALIAVLWVTTALGLLTTVGLAEVEVYRVATENRLLQRRAYWAARGCLAVLQARNEGGERRAVAPIELAPGVACEAWWEDPQERLNPNHVDSVALVRLLDNVVATASLLDWMDADQTPRPAGAEASWYRARGLLEPRDGPVLSTREILLVRGFETVPQEWVDSFFTTDGDGRIDPNHASREVLASLSMLSPQEGVRIASLRERHELSDAEEVMNAAGARLNAEAFRALSARLVPRPSTHMAKIVGQASGDSRTLRLILAVNISEEGNGIVVREVRVHP